MNKDVQIIDVGIGNIASVFNMLKRIGANPSLTTNPEKISAGSKLILPGVGAFDAGIVALRKFGIEEAVCEASRRGVYILGICLGMQLLFGRSEEGDLPGLGLINGHVDRIKPKGKSIKIPHMGWNVIRPVQNSSLFSLNAEEQRFYFVHSYHAVCDNPSDVTALVNHGYDFTCAVQRENIFGVQFHPEKSHRFGMSLLKKFIEL